MGTKSRYLCGRVGSLASRLQSNRGPSPRQSMTGCIALATFFLSMSSCVQQALAADDADDDIARIRLALTTSPLEAIALVDWVERTTVPAWLPTPVKQAWTGVYLGEDIALPAKIDRQPEKNAPARAVLLADTIRINGPTEIRLDGGGTWNIAAIPIIDFRGMTPGDGSKPSTRRDPKQLGAAIDGQKDGGTLVLLARRLIVGDAGRLTFHAESYTVANEIPSYRLTDIPTAGRPPQKEFDKLIAGAMNEARKRYPEHGGDLYVIAERIEVPGVERDDFERSREAFLKLVTANLKGEKRDGKVLVVQKKDGFASWMSRELLESWVEARIRLVHGRILESLRTNDQRKFAEAVRQYRSIPESDVLSEDSKRRITEIQAIVEPRDVLIRRTLALRQGGLPRSIDVVRRGTSLENFALPTNLFVQPNTVRGRKIVGLIQLDSKDEGRVRLSFDVALAVDPWLEQLATRSLAETQETLAGVFDDWDLRGGDPPDGVEEIRVTSAGVGRFQCTIVADREAADFVLFRLSSRNGLPIRLRYEARGQSGLRGELLLPLSLARRTENDLLLAGGMAKNQGKRTITIEYIRAGDVFLPLFPALAVAPDATVTIPLLAGADSARLSIPPSGVVYADLDPGSLDEFLVIKPEDLIGTVTVTNLLGADQARGGTLFYVEVKLSYLVDGVDAGQAPSSGPVRLSPWPAMGSERRLTFIKPRRGRERVRIEGKAVYENGEQAIGPRTLDGTSVRITEDLLPPLEDRKKAGK